MRIFPTLAIIAETLLMTKLSDKLFKQPKPNESCSSYDEAKSKIKDFLIPIQTFKACEKDCVELFRNELSSAKTCPKCERQDIETLSQRAANHQLLVKTKIWYTHTHTTGSYYPPDGWIFA